MVPLILKAVHILAAVFFLGFGLASFFYKFASFRTKDARLMLWCDRNIVLADYIFTIPSGLILPLTGVWLVVLYNIPFTTPWVLVGLVGYGLAGLTWLPAAVLQVRMRRLAEDCVRDNRPVPDAYGRMFAVWAGLGAPSFGATVIVIWAMVAKWAAF